MHKSNVIATVHTNPGTQDALTDLRGAIDARWTIEAECDRKDQSVRSHHSYQDACDNETLRERDLIQAIIDCYLSITADQPTA
jgi:hypothetical protein